MQCFIIASEHHIIWWWYIHIKKYHVDVRSISFILRPTWFISLKLSPTSDASRTLPAELLNEKHSAKPEGKNARESRNAKLKATAAKWKRLPAETKAKVKPNDANVARACAGRLVADFTRRRRWRGRAAVPLNSDLSDLRGVRRRQVAPPSGGGANCSSSGDGVDGARWGGSGRAMSGMGGQRPGGRGTGALAMVRRLSASSSYDPSDDSADGGGGSWSRLPGRLVM